MDEPPAVSPNGDADRRVAALQAELDSVRRREAEYRAKMIQEFLDRGERNTYLHVLREERTALIKREQEASADLEILTRKIESAEARVLALEAELALARRPWWRRFLPGAGIAPSPQAAGKDPVPGAPFTYYLHTSPFRVYRDAVFTLRGWAWPEDGRAVTGVRVDLDGRLFEGRCGIEEPEVVARYAPQPHNPRPGFEITFETPPGRHSFSLEAQLAGSEWRSVMRTSIWCEPHS
ncbi:MAG: hypothetical protein WCA95_01935 [Opitutaceae bacterium]